MARYKGAAFGRSRGRFSTEIHLKTDLDGNPLDFHLTGGDTNRVAALARGITPVIPRRENSKQRGRFFPRRFYKLRARSERAIGKLKRFKRIAMRCD
jgi:hypothetical protein